MYKYKVYVYILCVTITLFQTLYHYSANIVLETHQSTDYNLFTNLAFKMGEGFCCCPYMSLLVAFKIDRICLKISGGKEELKSAAEGQQRWACTTRRPKMSSPTNQQRKKHYSKRRRMEQWLVECETQKPVHVMVTQFKDLLAENTSNRHVKHDHVVCLRA